ncbi:MAG: peptidyl-prolyl cis-trans isomerase, cyclophilin type [Nocardioidaceae bacterium]|nr:peptidyl-prolyl cis-trans isomerase, cyclophilin type [Nocardioidaceae bacterium]
MTPRTRTTSQLVATLAALLLAAGACGSGSDSSGSADKGSSASPSASDGTCAYADDTLVPASKPVDKPPATPTVSGDVKATITTNQGKIPVILDATHAPCAVNSFVSLAAQKYYDNSACSRVVSDSRGVGILQCGDPTGTGNGGPGYTFKEEVTGKEQYALGVIAMAKRNDPASTGGQFFMMFADSTQAFPPEYTILGKVANAAGLKVLQKAGTVAMTGKQDGYDGEPGSPIVITKVTAG